MAAAFQVLIKIVYKVRKLTVGYIVKENKSLVHGFVKVSKNGHNSGKRLAKSAVLHGERECGKLGKQEVSCGRIESVMKLSHRKASLLQENLGGGYR